MKILEALQSLPYVQVILSDEHKTICSVKIAVERTERIDSGSMMFHHPRYLVFGQTVVFCDMEVSSEQSGALFFSVSSGEEAAVIIKNIADSFSSTKEFPNDSILIKQVI